MSTGSKMYMCDCVRVCTSLYVNECVVLFFNLNIGEKYSALHFMVDVIYHFRYIYMFGHWKNRSNDPRVMECNPRFHLKSHASTNTLIHTHIHTQIRIYKQSHKHICSPRYAIMCFCLHRLYIPCIL